MITPPPLKPGDKTGIVATARKIDAEAIQPAIAVLKSWGLEVIVGDTIGQSDHQFAGNDEMRRIDFQGLLDDENVRAILFAKGGYGTIRIVDDIDWRKFLKSPKWLCGYSDITILQSHLQAVYGVSSMHSIMCSSFSTATSESIDLLRRMLFGEKISYDLPSSGLNRHGEASAILTGGNLSLLYSLAGTSSDADTVNKILFIEDIDEHYYHLDRMMISLKRSGKLEHLAGLVAGHFTDMKNKDLNDPFGKTAYEIIAEHVSAYQYPVCYGFPAGHETQNWPMVMGGMWKLSVGERVIFKMM